MFLIHLKSASAVFINKEYKKKKRMFLGGVNHLYYFGIKNKKINKKIVAYKQDISFKLKLILLRKFKSVNTYTQTNKRNCLKWVANIKLKKKN